MRWFARSGCAIGLLVLCAATDAVAGAPPGTFAVTTEGLLPGFAEDQLASYVATQMTKAKAGNWQFVAAKDAAQSAEGQVQWSFKTAPSATGALRTYGFSRAMMERLVAARRYVTIEAKLFLHGEYQTETLGQATITMEGEDPALDAEIVKMVQLLMSYPASTDERPVEYQAGEKVIQPTS